MELTRLNNFLGLLRKLGLFLIIMIFFLLKFMICRRWKRFLFYFILFFFCFCFFVFVFVFVSVFVFVFVLFELFRKREREREKEKEEEEESSWEKIGGLSF